MTQASFADAVQFRKDRVPVAGGYAAVTTVAPVLGAWSILSQNHGCLPHSLRSGKSDQVQRLAGQQVAALPVMGKTNRWRVGNLHHRNRHDAQPPSPGHILGHGRPLTGPGHYSQSPTARPHGTGVEGTPAGQVLAAQLGLDDFGQPLVRFQILPKPRDGSFRGVHIACRLSVVIQV